MAYTTINKSTDHFTTTTWTGDNTTPKTFTTGTFKPDWLWGKNRSQSYSHQIYDTTRGAGNDKELVSDTNGAQGASNPETYGYVSAFTSTGFTATKGTDSAGYDYWNENPDNYVAWSWKANGGTTASNSNGSITSTVQANTTAGFSIVTWTGSGANATIGHGLGVVPAMIIVKNLSATESWVIYHHKNTSAPETDFLRLNSDAATADGNTVWNDTAPTSSVFTVSTSPAANGNGNNMIAYCFAEKTGYSKFGSYTGNNASENVFVYTGFKPKFFITKRTSATAQWVLWDGTRDTSNPMLKFVYPSTNGAEGSSAYIDFLSNGVKVRDNNNKWGNGTYIYMAFGQSLVGTNNIPAVAF